MHMFGWAHLFLCWPHHRELVIQDHDIRDERYQHQQRLCARHGCSVLSWRSKTIHNHGELAGQQQSARGINHTKKIVKSCHCLDVNSVSPTTDSTAQRHHTHIMEGIMLIGSRCGSTEPLYEGSILRLGLTSQGSKKCCSGGCKFFGCLKLLSKSVNL